MRVQSDLDRFHLVQDVVDRVPNLGSKGAYLKRQMQDKLIEHKHYIDKHGQDLPENRNWKWSRNENENGKSPASNTRQSAASSRRSNRNKNGKPIIPKQMKGVQHAHSTH